VVDDQGAVTPGQVAGGACCCRNARDAARGEMADRS